MSPPQWHTCPRDKSQYFLSFSLFLSISVFILVSLCFYGFESEARGSRGKQPLPVLVRLTNTKRITRNKFSASLHQLTAGPSSFDKRYTTSFQSSELFTQTRRHKRRDTPWRKLTSQPDSKGLAAQVPSPFISPTTSLSFIVTARPR